MAVIHHTTMSPGKLELLASWLPSQPWYAGNGKPPEPVKAGGFRLDDPDGEVGIEFMVVGDLSADRPVAYLVPLGYRGTPLDGADHALVGTSEHGVLGTRWIYDGTHDPVVVAQLLALLQGRAEPQAQNDTGVHDRSVVPALTPAGSGVLFGPRGDAGGVACSVTQGGDATFLHVAGTPDVTVEVRRVLRPGGEPGGEVLGHVTAGWRSPDGDEPRGPFLVLRPAQG
ncbi:1,4-alpha-glucan branching protein [Streptomyces sp. NPDC048338]|uniref:maltokinase N-terminal cap-like domain-containing protein n=1 Tax=Streptomyces sp. NPDC048338 TaxID=3365536 RepID=UPI0037184323